MWFRRVGAAVRGSDARAIGVGKGETRLGNARNGRDDDDDDGERERERERGVGARDGPETIDVV